MSELIPINYNGEEPTVSARDLHAGLEIKSNFTTWFDRMCEYGFTELDYKKCFPNLESCLAFVITFKSSFAINHHFPIQRLKKKRYKLGEHRYRRRSHRSRCRQKAKQR